MTAPLAMCPDGHVAEVPGIQMVGPGTSTFIGGASNCPVCGKPTEILSGDYTTEHDGSTNARLVLTASQLRRLAQSLEWARQELANPTPDEEHAVRVLEKTIEVQAPQVKAWLDRFKGSTSMATATWLGALMTVLTLLLQIFGTDQGVSGDELERILDETVRAIHSEQSTEAPVTPPRPPTVTELPAPETH